MMDAELREKLGRRKLTEGDLVRMRIPPRFWESRFSEIAEAGEVRAKIGKYLGDLHEMLDRGFGFMLWGPNGLGKTAAGVVVLKEARRRGYTAMFLGAAELKDIVVSKKAFDTDQTLWDRARYVDFLLIDDLGKGSQDEKGFGERLLDDLIRTRSSSLKVTWLTTNMTPTVFKEEHKISTFAAMEECMLPVRMHGENRRAGVAEEMKSRFG